MGTELKLLNQMFDREIENVVTVLANKLGFGSFSNKACEFATQYLHKQIDPYIEAFIGADGKVDTDTACEFVKEKAASEIEAFKAKLKKEE